MITFIRRHFGTKTYKAILWITVLSVIGLTSVTGLFKRFSGLPSTDIAMVDGYVIEHRQFVRKVQEEEHRLAYIRKQFGAQADLLLQQSGISGNPREMALNNLIQEKLLESTAAKMGLYLSSAYIGAMLNNPMFIMQNLGELVPPFVFDSMGINHQALAKHLQRQGLSMHDFEEAVERSLTHYLVLSLAGGATSIPNSLLREQFVRQYGSKQFDIIIFNLDRYLQEVRKVSITPEEAQKHYDAAQQRYAIPEERRGTLWTFVPEDYAIAPELFEKTFSADAQRMILQAKGNPKAFDEFVAKKKGKKSAISGTVQQSPQHKKLFSIKEKTKAFMVEQGKGYILELESIEPGKQQPLSAVKAEVINDIYRERAYKEMANDLRVAGRELKQGLSAEIAKKFNAHHEKTGMLAADAPQWEDLKKKDLPIQRMQYLVYEGSHFDAISKQHGYLVQLTKVRPIDEEKFASTKRELYKALYATENQQTVYGFIASLHRNAKINVNQATILGGQPGR